MFNHTFFSVSFLKKKPKKKNKQKKKKNKQQKTKGILLVHTSVHNAISIGSAVAQW